MVNFMITNYIILKLTFYRYVYLYISICCIVYICIHIHIYIYMYVCACVCVYNASWRHRPITTFQTMKQWSPSNRVVILSSSSHVGHSGLDSVMLTLAWGCWSHPFNLKIIYWKELFAISCFPLFYFLAQY